MNEKVSLHFDLRRDGRNIPGSHRRLNVSAVEVIRDPIGVQPVQQAGDFRDDLARFVGAVEPPSLQRQRAVVRLEREHVLAELRSVPIAIPLSSSAAVLLVHEEHEPDRPAGHEIELLEDADGFPCGDAARAIVHCT